MMLSPFRNLTVDDDVDPLAAPPKPMYDAGGFGVTLTGRDAGAAPAGFSGGGTLGDTDASMLSGSSASAMQGHVLRDGALSFGAVGSTTTTAVAAMAAVGDVNARGGPRRCEYAVACRVHGNGHECRLESPYMLVLHTHDRSRCHIFS